MSFSPGFAPSFRRLRLPAPFEFIRFSFNLFARACHDAGLSPSFIAFAAAVGQNKESFPLMRRADFVRREYSRRNSVAHLLQVSGNFAKTESDVSRDILEPNKSGLRLSDNAGNLRPEMTGIGSPEPLAGLAEGRTRVACNDAIHNSTPRVPFEGA
jgi:hypothetical protein